MSASNPTLFSQASAEVIGLHRFFVDWFVAARADKADFSRFERAMGDGFGMVAPDGQVLDRDAVVDHVRSRRASCVDGCTISREASCPGWTAVASAVSCAAMVMICPC